MSLTRSHIVPTAFWVAFLVLGFFTSLGGGAKHHADAGARGIGVAKSVRATAGGAGFEGGIRPALGTRQALASEPINR